MQSKTFIDTNYLLRYLLCDVPTQTNQVKKLLLEYSKNKQTLKTSIVCIFEVVWVLSSFYEKDKNTTANKIKELLQITTISVSRKQQLIDAANVYKQSSISFTDAYLIEYSKSIGIKEFKTFDKKLLKQFKK